MLECDSGVVVVVVVVEALVSLLRYWLRFCPLDVDGIIFVVVVVGDSHVGGAGGRASGGGRATGGRAGGDRPGGGGRQ